MADIKPCPFCGSVKAAAFTYLGDDHAVRCEDCGAEPYVKATVTEAIDAWNTRPTEDALRAELELYAEAMDKGPEWAASEAMLALNEEVAKECDRANRAEERAEAAEARMRELEGK